MEVHNCKTYKGFTLPLFFANFEESIYNFEVYDSDVWILTFPKSGTTWTQEIIWLLCNDFKFEVARTTSNILRFPFLEMSGLMSVDGDFEKSNVLYTPYKHSVDYANNINRPRLIKSHLPWNLLPRQIQSGEKKPKIVFVTRNPKDTFVSYYYHYKMGGKNMNFDFDTFLQKCINGQILYTPFWNHIFSITENIKSHNIFLMKYEDMKENIEREIKRLCQYLEIEYPNAEKLQKLLEYTKLDSMQKNSAVNLPALNPEAKDIMFIRKGLVGDYKSLIDANKELIIDQWIDDNLDKRGFNRNSIELPVRII